MGKRILFVSPKRPSLSSNAAVSEMLQRNHELIRPWYTAPLGLLTVAALTPKRFEIEFVDEDFEPIHFDGSYDIVAISAMTQQANRAYEIADIFRQRFSTNVVMGGIHATVLPDEALQHVNTVFIGEAEKIWEQYLNDWEQNKVKKVYTADNTKPIDLALSPVPMYELINQKNIKKNKHFFNMIPVQATRGCPHNCSFCLVSKFYGKRIRKKTISQVIQEVKAIKSLFKNQLVVFADDNLFVDKKYAKSLCRALIPLKIKWFAQTDVSFAQDEELIDLAYSSGCLMVLIGFESLNKNNLSILNKNLWKLRRHTFYDGAVDKIQKAGIIVYAAFIVGFDHDDTTVFRLIRNFMIEHHCTGQITIMTPLPGTEIYDQFKGNNRLLTEKYWDKCNFFDIVYSPKKMTIKELEHGFIWLYNEIFNMDALENRTNYLKSIYKQLPPRWKQ